MSGFICVLGNGLQIPELYQDEKMLLVSSVVGDGYHIERRTIRKFAKDKVFVDGDKHVILLDGVVTNNHDLMKQYRSESWCDCVEGLYDRQCLLCCQLLS